MGCNRRLWAVVLALGWAAAHGCCLTECGTRRGALMPLGDGCDTSCAPACGPCGGLFAPFRSLLSCGSGCGELYVDEWLSDPPACCDPCDDCGTHTGPSGCCRWLNYPLHRGNFWGTRLADAGCGCDSCSARADHGHHPLSNLKVGEEVIVDEQWSEEMVVPYTATPNNGSSPLGPGPRALSR